MTDVPTEIKWRKVKRPKSLDDRGFDRSMTPVFEAKPCSLKEHLSTTCQKQAQQNNPNSPWLPFLPCSLRCFSSYRPFLHASYLISFRALRSAQSLPGQPPSPLTPATPTCSQTKLDHTVLWILSQWKNGSMECTENENMHPALPLSWSGVRLLSHKVTHRDHFEATNDLKIMKIVSRFQ